MSRMVEKGLNLSICFHSFNPWDIRLNWSYKVTKVGQIVK